MNKKLLTLLCAVAAFGTNHAMAQNTQTNQGQSGVTLTLGVGMATTHSAAIENTTTDLADVTSFPATEKDKVKTNAYAKFGKNFAQAYAMPFSSTDNIETPTTGSDTVIIPGYVLYKGAADSEFAKNFFPTLGATVKIPSSSTSAQARDLLYANGTWKEVQCYTPMIRYDTLDQIVGGQGIDVSLGVGYKMFINGGLYLHPSVHFAYFNAKSKNAIQTGYEGASFYLQGVNAQYITESTKVPQDAPKDPVPVYTLDPETKVDQGISGSIANALTYETQWYWRFVTAMGYQINEGLSVEALVGYQMTRCKLSLLQSNAAFKTPLKDFLDPVDNSPIHSSIAVTDGASAYNFKDNVSPVEQTQAKMISGIVLGFGMNFNIAQNLSMGVQLTTVCNMKREYAMDVLYAPTVEATSATTTNQANTEETNSSAQSNPSTTFQAKMAQHQTGVAVTFTYLLPVGGECNTAS